MILYYGGVLLFEMLFSACNFMAGLARGQDSADSRRAIKSYYILEFTIDQTSAIVSRIDDNSN